jgi:hypothetical protein
MTSLQLLVMWLFIQQSVRLVELRCTKLGTFHKLHVFILKKEMARHCFTQFCHFYKWLTFIVFVMQDFCASFMHSLYEVHLNIKLPFFICHFSRRFLNTNRSTFGGGGACTIHGGFLSDHLCCIWYCIY